MTKEQIDTLRSKGCFSSLGCFRDSEDAQGGGPDLIETHISWVLLCDQFVFKIKKPISYSFLDFSTLEKRKYYCEKEVTLNKRLTDDIYIDVQPVNQIHGCIFIGNEEGDIIDYAVRMRKADRNRQMDVLLKKNEVGESDIRKLAETIARFHNKTTIIYQKYLLDIQNKFNDLRQEVDYLSEYLGKESYTIINRAMEISDGFMQRNKAVLAGRLREGFYRDCHGDLHSRNIFLLESPEPFDCIEFNDDYRQIDVLNEVAFLCMDLDAFGRQDLSDLFLDCYNSLFHAMKTDDDRKLFLYYKGYRANIRAKVNSLRARDAGDDASKKPFLSEAGKYLRLMDTYMNTVSIQ